VHESDLVTPQGDLDAARQIRYLVRDDGDLAVVCADGPHVGALVPPHAHRPDAAADELIVEVSRPPQGGAPVVTATIGGSGHRKHLGVTVVPSEVDVFDRLRGIFESDRLRHTCVLVVGCGSGGSFVIRELVRCGVGRFILLDHDRLEIANVCRHELGLGDLGRLKTSALRDYIHDRNPVATVETHSFHLDGSTFERFLGVVEEARPNLMICGTDNRESRLLVNRASLLHGITTLYGGVRRRAYAGQVLRVIPALTACYQCFVHGLPTVASDNEVSSPEAAQRVAYSDRPVIPEPGLSTDILRWPYSWRSSRSSN